MSVPAIPSVYDNLLSYLVEKATPEETLAHRAGSGHYASY